MSPAESELFALSQKLLAAITAGDWTAYADLCDPDITCFEPEAQGHLVCGLPFHKFYFDMPGSGAPKQSTISSPSIRVLGDVGIVCYVRLVQRIDLLGEAVTSVANETRVWKKTPQGWKHIHFHRTPV